MIGEFYCARLDAPLLVEVDREGPSYMADTLELLLGFLGRPLVLLAQPMPNHGYGVTRLIFIYFDVVTDAVGREQPEHGVGDKAADKTGGERAEPK